MGGGIPDLSCLSSLSAVPAPTWPTPGLLFCVPSSYHLASAWCGLQPGRVGPPWAGVILPGVGIRVTQTYLVTCHNFCSVSCSLDTVSIHLSLWTDILCAWELRTQVGICISCAQGLTAWWRSCLCFPHAVLALPHPPLTYLVPLTSPLPCGVFCACSFCS